MKEMAAEREVEKEAMAKFKGWADHLKAQLREKDLVIQRKDRLLDAKGTGTIHLECKDGRIRGHHVEQLDADESVLCYSDPANNTRCHHVVLKGSEVSYKVKNVRWPGERKL